MRKNRKYTDAFKEKVVKEYLSGATPTELWMKYEIDRRRISNWTHKWREHGGFPDGRGKSSKGKTGRPRLHTTVKEEMTKDEYIAYLEMQLEIKKYLAFYEKRKQN